MVIMKEFLKHLESYSEPMFSKGRFDLDINLTDDQFEIQILEWVLAESEESGVNIHDLRDLIQQRIWKLEM
ncbi:MAG: hypothetical protein DRJ07_19010 [Bacteroidetes bacterium]|nr:MAG: hypothetical protein DRJ07_19010 [Bacteroidota bacterium]